MSWIHIFFALILLLAIAAGMIRILRGPTAADRMMTAQLFGTCGVAILLLLSAGMASPVLVDIALVFALLAALATLTFVRRTWQDPGKKRHGYPLL
ncbi:multisubunit Na+/H+ antiporter, MnhF subunit [Desulfocapsa sulfexigens DSM 10523]|uniref:Multisubunit Na+/H+ antiporter, MnhF subunit n=1 Tax=Desulfocapsa sulfexigens (strain DSM 10523 / SB164P1) TaxID=1167006 RepID=M1PSY8_DESSD|nr:monovalent cation/H+ antiporter complex subunit F [Desulfocapsa sulfexigens]AGF79431.1 multisubunit Na+/H+ antiporter, MnhF subunit [Desulfocapsa sulfexigens DSM 10523]